VVGDWSVSDIEIVCAFDIDRRKVGKPLEQAIFAKPNCTTVFQAALPVSNVIVQMGPILDGIADHMADYADDSAFRPADAQPVEIAKALKESRAEVLICYLPVGSEQAEEPLGPRDGRERHDRPRRQGRKGVVLASESPADGPVVRLHHDRVRTQQRGEAARERTVVHPHDVGA
jgi:myo-inositol-1-phosphate synthase